MLYSILPPVIIILSLIAIIIFLVKRASRVVSIREMERGTDIEELQESGFFRRFMRGVSNFFKIRLKNWFLIALEKLSRKFRTFFLKMESFFSRKSAQIRDKRKMRKMEAERDKTEGEIAIEEKIEEEIYSKETEKEAKEIKDSDIIIEEKQIKPMISDRVVSPRRRSEIKDILEDVLIERIAVNPKDVEAYERLGEYYMEIGNYEHAKECVKQVIRLDPTNRSAKYKMRRLERLMSE